MSQAFETSTPVTVPIKMGRITINGGLVTIGGRTALTFQADDFKRKYFERISAGLDFPESDHVDVLSHPNMMCGVLVFRRGKYFHVEFEYVSLKFNAGDMRKFASAILEAKCALYEEREANASKRRHKSSCSI